MTKRERELREMELNELRSIRDAITTVYGGLVPLTVFLSKQMTKIDGFLDSKGMTKEETPSNIIEFKPIRYSKKGR
jgi:hypothetical protein